MGYRFTESLEWKTWVTPRESKEKAIHQWYLFPHSFTGDLVHALLEEWSLGPDDTILDPFVGAGTTLLAAKEKHVPGCGYDLSPLAVLAANTKVAAFTGGRLRRTWVALRNALKDARPTTTRKTYPELVRKALPAGRLDALDTIARRIDRLDCSLPERNFFRLALIAVIPRFSLATANGGWLRWSTEGADTGTVLDAFTQRVEMMLTDVRRASPDAGGDSWCARVADARALPDRDGTYSAVITSPPYPNRHDYTRVFGVELMFSFLDWEQNRRLRYQSFHSHPEARPRRPEAAEYKPPARLEENVRDLSDHRIRRMLRGYFLDMYLCLREVVRVCRGGGMAAFVVGNARYDGNAILVDEFTAELGERAGLVCREIRAVRWRGNSAQQMGRHGRVASRESIVVFEKR